MAFFDRFKRQKNTVDTGMPTEVQDYYKAERRDRTGRAWLLAIATLLVTFLLAAGLFFGGRFIYRAIFDRNDDFSQTQEQSEEQPDSATQNPSDAPATTPTPSGPQTSSTNTATTPSASTPTPSTNTPTAAPSAGPGSLVNTGPGDE